MQQYFLKITIINLPIFEEIGVVLIVRQLVLVVPWNRLCPENRKKSLTSNSFISEINLIISLLR